MRAANERAIAADRAHRNDAAGFEAEIGRLNCTAVANERRGDDEEEQRDGDLSRHEDFAERSARDATAQVPSQGVGQ